MGRGRWKGVEVEGLGRPLLESVIDLLPAHALSDFLVVETIHEVDVVLRWVHARLNLTN